MGERLSIVLGPHGQVADLRSGAVTIEGIDPDFITVSKMTDAYRDMARTQPYQISEMAPTSYLMALAGGAPLTAFPIPMTRRFRHGGVLRLKDGAISGPGDLAGKTVGVRAYAVTAAVWTRGVLAEDYGFDPDSITWVTQESENDESFTPPSNVQLLGDSDSFAAMMAEGRMQAAFAGPAGLGEDHGLDVTELVPGTAAREADWFKRTGIYPIHGVIVVRNDVIAQIPDIGRRLFAAFKAAKDNYWARVESGAADEKEDIRYLKLSKVVGDPLPYGLEENRKSLEALVRYAHGQKLIKNAPAIENVFVDPLAGTGRVAEWRS